MNSFFVRKFENKKGKYGIYTDREGTVSESILQSLYPPIHCVFWFFSVGCAPGLFGFSCNKICHCKNATEDCLETNGHCASGCAQYFTGDTCQGDVLCPWVGGVCIHLEP